MGALVKWASFQLTGLRFCSKLPLGITDHSAIYSTCLTIFYSQNERRSPPHLFPFVRPSRCCPILSAFSEAVSSLLPSICYNSSAGNSWIYYKILFCSITKNQFTFLSVCRHVCVSARHFWIGESAPWGLKVLKNIQNRRNCLSSDGLPFGSTRSPVRQPGETRSNLRWRRQKT